MRKRCVIVILVLLLFAAAVYLLAKPDPATILAGKFLKAQFSGCYAEVWDSLAPNIQQMYVDKASASEMAETLARDYGHVERLDYRGSSEADPSMRRRLGYDLSKHTWLVKAENKDFQYCLFWGSDGKIKGFRIRPQSSQR